MKKFLIALAMVSLLLAAPARAVVFTPTGAIITVDYTEPILNADNSPLTDLAKCTVYYQFGGDPNVVLAKEIPATVVTGGGTVRTTIDIPITPGQEKDIDGWMTATDLTGKEAARSVI